MRFSALFVLLLLSRLSWAQDVILRTSGEEVPAKVLTIRPERISYVLPAAPTDTLYLNTPEVFMIRYANGTKEVLHQPAATAATAAAAAPALTAEQARLRGRQDARDHYRAKGAFWGTYGSTVAYPLIGLAAGTVIAATPPRPDNLPIVDPALRQNPDYMRAYTSQAHRRKVGSAAGGFGAGLGTLSVAVFVFALVFFSH